MVYYLSSYVIWLLEYRQQRKSHLNPPCLSLILINAAYYCIALHYYMYIHVYIWLILSTSDISICCVYK